MLSVDPYRWNAEHGTNLRARTVASVATVARVKAENSKSNLAETAATVATAATHALPQSRIAVLLEWRTGLATLNYTKPPSGFTTMRWGQLLDNAEFIFNGFGDQLARQGWSSLYVFGVLPWRAGGGVLLDRLQEARNLKLDGQGRAFWSCRGVTFQTSCDVGEHLVSLGLLLIWDRRMIHAGSNP